MPAETCDWRGPMDETLDRVRAGDPDPVCVDCGGMLKSATISFGENLVAADLDRAQRAAAGADLFLALGTSLGVSLSEGVPQEVDPAERGSTAATSWRRSAGTS